MNETLLINQEKIHKWISSVKIESKIDPSTNEFNVLKYGDLNIFDIEEGKIILKVLNQLNLFIMVWCNIQEFAKHFLFKPNTKKLYGRILFLLNSRIILFQIKSRIKNNIPKFNLLLNVFTVPLHIESKDLNTQLFNIWKEIVEKSVPTLTMEMSLEDYRILKNFYKNCSIKSKDYEIILDTLARHFNNYNKLDI